MRLFAGFVAVAWELKLHADASSFRYWLLFRFRCLSLCLGFKSWFWGCGCQWRLTWLCFWFGDKFRRGSDEIFLNLIFGCL